MIGIVSHRARLHCRAAVAATLLASAALAPVSAASATSVGPGQSFTGQTYPTNGIVRVACFPGNVGRPLPGQYVKVVQGGFGYTGTAATYIWVYFPKPFPPGGNNSALFINTYNTLVPIGTNLDVPCGGSGQVTFVPQPGSPTARTYTLNVSFVV